MDDICVSNDDMTAGFFLRRPTRAERAVDDPIREMEGILVDEYGRCVLFFLFILWQYGIAILYFFIYISIMLFYG